MFYEVNDGVDCFEVGIQQLLDWMGWSDYHRDSFVSNYTLASFISYVNVGAYVVVECAAYFGEVLCPDVCRSYLNLDDALAFVNRQYDSYDYPLRHEYEIWHVVDDGDLWQAWEHDSELSRVDVPVMLDSRVCNYLQDASLVSYAETLYRTFVPCLGDFLSFVQLSFLRLDFPGFGCVFDESEYVVLDDGLMPSDFRQLDDRFDDFEIVSAEDVRFLHDPLERLRVRRRQAADVMESLRQLREAGDLCGGDGVGAAC